MNFIKKIKHPVVAAATFALVGYSGFLIGEHKTQAQIEQLLDLISLESRTVSQFEYEAVKLAETYEGEAKGQPDEWVWEASAPAMPSAILNCVNDERFPDTVLGVLLQPLSSGKALAINALGDHIPENLSTKRGQLALTEAARVLVAHYDGTFVPSHNGHSWATPAAAEGHDYFEGLIPVAKGTGHIYFADVPDDTMVRPDVPRDNAPTESLRPQARPADSIILALMEAQAD